MRKSKPIKPTSKPTTPPPLTPMKKALAEGNTRIRALEAELGVKPEAEATTIDFACRRMSWLEKQITAKERNED